TNGLRMCFLLASACDLPAKQPMLDERIVTPARAIALRRARRLLHRDGGRRRFVVVIKPVIVGETVVVEAIPQLAKRIPPAQRARRGDDGLADNWTRGHCC